MLLKRLTAHKLFLNNLTKETAWAMAASKVILFSSSYWDIPEM
jgi:hypothetical protein